MKFPERKAKTDNFPKKTEADMASVLEAMGARNMASSEPVGAKSFFNRFFSRNTASLDGL